MTKNIGVLTSGGDSSGMNATIRAVVRTGIYHGCKVFGIHKGFDGLISNNITEMTVGSVGGIICQGGTILQTARSKRFMEYEGRKEAFENLKKHEIDSLIVIGGDGSFHGLHELIREFGIQGIGLPGTIDNDLYGTEFTIGFDTAVNTALEAINKIRDTASSHSRIFIVEVMGRHAGYIAIYSAIASGAEEVFIPETNEDIQAVCDRIQKGQDRGKLSSIIVVAEGDEMGGAFAVRDRMIKINGHWDIRVSILGHIQRGGAPSAIDSLIGSRLGYESVLAVLNNKTDIMVGYMGLDNDVSNVPLKETWEKRKIIRDDWKKMASVLAI